MLSDTSRPVIEATLPAVADNIQTIAQRFYEHLFEGHPELLDGVFNRGNQKEGTQQQALAGSIAVFASALVEHPDRLPWHLLSRVAHKHASLGLRPEQYEVVYDNLFWAIADVLGDAVTPGVAAAWSEVYWLMAWALINQERGLYSARGVGADTIWREWEVTEKIRETDDVVTFRFRRTDDRLVRTSLPGQYVTVQVPMPDGVRQPRQYSLTSVDWAGARLIEGDVAEAVRRLKAEDGGELQVHGSAGLIQTLLRHDLVDELRLIVFPVTVGQGKRLFGDGALPRAWRLAASRATSTGALLLTYQRAGELRTGEVTLEDEVGAPAS